MNDEYSGIERRLDELSERLTRLEILQKKPKWERVYSYLQNTQDLRQFLEYVRNWLNQQ